MSTGSTKSHFAKKSPLVVFAAAALWAVLVCFVIWPWIVLLDHHDLFLAVFAHSSAAIWWAALLWALHHLAFQVGGLFRQPSPRPTRHEQPNVAILYTTCDDFNQRCTLSCIQQDYPSVHVVVCDDSHTEEYQKLVDEFCHKHIGHVELSRRTEKAGFKAGNLNHAFRRHVHQDWVLLVDADQILPRDYVRRLVSAIPEEFADVAFIQAAHEAEVNEQSSPLQRALAPGAQFFYRRDMAIREAYGFVPLLGHGALIPTAVWRACGGFPEIVSEDFAFALESLNQGRRGRYVRDVVSYETFPYDFSGFMIRIRKYAAGTAELLRTVLGTFLRGPATFVEKWDFLMMLGWYLLMPLLTVNGFVAAYVCHRYWTQATPVLHPLLPCLYTLLVLAALALCVSVSERLSTAVKFYFWSTAIFTAAMPVAGSSFLRHLFTRAVFHRTPKNGTPSRIETGEAVPMVLLGAIAAGFALIWCSPFSPVLAGQAIAYLSYPLYGHLCSESVSGKVARLVIYLPGTVLLSAIVVAWRFVYL